MPRLVLSLPTELGPDRPSRDRAVRTGRTDEYRSIGRPDVETGDERPRIERWLACWADADRADTGTSRGGDLARER